MAAKKKAKLPLQNHYLGTSCNAASPLNLVNITNLVAKFD